MYKIFLGVICFIIFQISYSQDSLTLIADSILAEAELIYKLEQSAEKSYETVKNKYSRKYFRKEIQWYLSYAKEDTIITFFWSNDSGNIRIRNIVKYHNDLGLTEYPNTFLSVDRMPTDYEAGLVNVWITVMRDKTKNYYTYSSVKAYRAEYITVIISGEENYRAYLLAELDKSYRTIPIGLEFYIELDENAKMQTREKIHKNYLPVDFDSRQINVDGELKGVIHTHLDSRSQYIAATDIYYILRYENYISWNEMTVLSKNYISTYNSDEHVLTIEIWDPKEK